MDGAGASGTRCVSGALAAAATHHARCSRNACAPGWASQLPRQGGCRQQEAGAHPGNGDRRGAAAGAKQRCRVQQLCTQRALQAKAEGGVIVPQTHRCAAWPHLLSHQRHQQAPAVSRLRTVEAAVEAVRGAARQVSAGRRQQQRRWQRTERLLLLLRIVSAARRWGAAPQAGTCRHCSPGEHGKRG